MSVWEQRQYVGVVIVIIEIFDMPRQEFPLYECVYILNKYMKSSNLCSETRHKFRVKFPGTVKNRKVKNRRHVLAEETLDEIRKRN